MVLISSPEVHVKENYLLISEEELYMKSPYTSHNVGSMTISRREGNAVVETII
jgi:hypothetical protein